MSTTARSQLRKTFVKISSNKFYVNMFASTPHLDHILDAVILVEGRTVRAHRFVLAAGSGYFNRMFTHVNTQHAIVFADIKYEHMRSILQYLYMGSTRIPSDDLDGFFKVAKHLEIIGLYKKIDKTTGSGDGTPATGPDHFTVTHEVQSDSSDSDDGSNSSTTAKVGKKGRRKAVHSMQNGDHSDADWNANIVLRNHAQLNKDSAASIGETPAARKVTNQPGTSKSKMPTSKVPNKKDSKQRVDAPAPRKRINHNVESTEQKRSKVEFKCPTCSETFSLQIALKKHRRTCVVETTLPA